MGNLVLTRRDGESVTLTAAPGYSPEQLLEALARDGIHVTVRLTESNQVRLAFEAPAAIDILRDELLHPC